MKPAEPLHLIYAADANFAMPTAVSLHSALRHLNAEVEVEVWIVDGGLKPWQRRRIERVARQATSSHQLTFHFVKPSSEWWANAELDFSSSSLKEATLYRLGAPMFMPADASRAIYLDGDTLIKADLVQMDQAMPDEAAIAATPDYCLPTWGRRCADRPEFMEQLGIDPEQPYFNAGAIVMNLDYWREHGVARQAAQFLSDHHRWCWLADQDALNYALVGRWHALPLTWNFPPTCRDKLSRRGMTVEQRTGMSFGQLQREAKLIHFTGAKPWNQGFTNPERPRFVAELKASRWFSKIGYAAWLVAWYRRLIVRGLHKTWHWKLRPRLSRAVARRRPQAAG